MVREDYSQSSVLSTLVGKPTNRYRKLAKNVSTLRSLTDPDKKPNNRLHYSLYPQIQREYQATITQLTNLDFHSPIVRIVGENPVSHIVGTPYTDEGIEIDDYGSTLTSTVSTVDDNVFGIYKVTYTASDGINDDTVVYRTVKVGLRPDATINGDNPYKLEKFNVYQDSGITINDSNSSLITTVSTVNNTEVGIYTVNYTVSNPAFTEVYSRTVRVDDTIPPVITISGDNPYTLERFDVYTDPGATVDLGSELTNIDLANVQNTNIGTFDVVYTAYDGNTTVHATRTVNVVDTVPPVITILGDNPYTLERFDPYVDPGATVDQGTTLTTDLTTVNNILSHGSSFVVTYSGTDGNTLHDVTQTRTVNVVDRKPPEITLLGDNPYEMQPGIDFRDVDPLYEVDLGTSVSIDYSNVVTTDNSVFYVVYRASDGVNPDTVVLRRVAVADTLSPIVTIIGDNPYTLERYAVYVDPGATTDTEAGSRFVSITNNINNTAVGSYTVTYDVTDDINANTIVQRIVNVVDTTAPIVTLNGASSVTLERYGVFSDIDEGVEIEAPGSLVSVDTSQLDNTTQGTYTVTYNVVDDQNNANVITREVVVQDTVPPVVTLNNESVSYTLERYGDWSEIDPGVTVDRGSYLYSVTVDNATVGPQVVTYTVKDGTNTTNNRQRIIDVVDTVAPVGSIANPSYQLERFAVFNDPGVENLDAGTYLAGTDTSNVDNTLAVGSTFDVIYDLGDGASNTILIRTVTVVDNTPPSGDINNPSFTLERFGVYSDPVPGVINLSQDSYIAGIDLTNVDNTLAAGSTFDVIYDLSDDVSNIYLTRTVTVVDTKLPVASLLGPNSITVERFSVWEDVDPGLTNFDEGSYLDYVSGFDNTTTGGQLVTYHLTDGVNSNTLTRSVTVQDTVAPIGSIVNPSYQLERFGIFSDPGVINLDQGSYIAGVDLTNVDNTLAHGSTFDVIYDLGDGVNNTYLTRTVTVVDTTPPTGTINNPSFTLERFSVYSDPVPGVINLDEGSYIAGIDLTNVDNTLPHNSTFDVIYDLGDGVNNTYLTRTVTIVDTVAPVGSIANPSYQLERFAVFNDPGVENLDAGTYLAGTDISNVDNTLPHNSTFDVIYDLGDDGVNNTYLTRTVTVVDTNAPSGTVNNPSFTLERFGVYSDPVPGVINLDQGSYIAGVDLTNVDNTLAHGSTFDVIYDLGDDVSNTTLVRTVTVVDTTSPSGTVNNPSFTLERFGVYSDPLPGVINLDQGSYIAGIDLTNVDNTLAAGSTFDVIYDLGDDVNNTYLTRTVTIVDTTPPIGTINNPSFTLERFSVYNDPVPGVINLDQGSYIAGIDLTNVDNTLAHGSTFDVIYDLGDDVNNTYLTRTVTIVDTTPPTGSMANPSYQLERFAVFNDPGVENLDAGTYLAGTDISNVDNTLPHNSTFDVIYDLSDDVSNTYLTRTVTVVDTKLPVASLLGPNSITVERFSVWEDVDPGLTNFDEGSYLDYVSGFDNTTTGGQLVTYHLTDGVNSNTLTRSVTVQDTVAPIGSIVNPSYQLERFGIFSDPGVENIDAGTYLASTDTSNVDNTLPHNSTFDVIYDLGDGVSNTILIRTVTVVDTTAPVITLIGANPLGVERYSTYSDPGATADGGETVTVDTSQVNTGVYGTYTATYSATDAVGNIGTTTRSVVVQPWVQQAQIQAVDKDEQDQFGRSVSISGDGNTAIVGSFRDGSYNTGSAYIFTRSGTSWSQQAKLVASNPVNYILFGYSVSISSDGNTAIVGASYEDSGSPGAGEAYIFTRSSGTSWSEQDKIQPSDTQNEDFFGCSVSISSNGNTAIVGAWGFGAAYIFTRSGTSWSQQAKVQGAGERFGWSVSISGDGNTAIVGAQRESISTGAAYVFTLSGGSWPQQAKLQASDKKINTRFGFSVSISSDGDTAIVGADQDSGYAGAAYVFTRSSGASWSEQAKIQASDKQSNDRFGYSVSISSDGNTAIMGAIIKGSAYIFTRSGTSWTEEQKIRASDGYFGYGSSIAGDGNTAIVGALYEDTGYTNAGSAYIFKFA